ncbi:23S rRNA methyluridine methyltransferase [Citrobacter koseri]|uniref:23S rRNA methyluridine methyltransferase n=1 Tax=Citrobacter koseri TaxID=545 RepID=A0A2X2UVW2_CITKO|nr:23S rRNA methyluridine methyltransferase [Citrobacter koseri]
MCRCGSVRRAFSRPTRSLRAVCMRRRVTGWRQLPVHHMWDLFCGVGGFGLHCATPEMTLTGIEIAPEAIACAKQSAAELGLTNLHFQALDSTRFATAQGEVPELVLVNPPASRYWKSPVRTILARWRRNTSSTPAATRRRWQRTLPTCRATVLSVFSFSICSRIPRIMKC